MTSREKEILNWIIENPMISQQELADKAGITRSSVAVHISNLIRKGNIAGKGYVVNPPSYTIVLGGVNMDIGGHPYNAIVPADSNPGQVSMSLGGVGRNIAHNLTLLDCNTKLMSAVGTDFYGQKILSSCNELGIDMTLSLQLANASTSTYMFISEPRGDMLLAISDMDIYEHITPAYLQNYYQILVNAQLIIIDTNIPEETISWLTNNISTPIFADPVSTAKAGKLKPVLGKIHTLKPNRMEAELLSGVHITDDESLKEAANILLDSGLSTLFISLGNEGVYAANAKEAYKIPCIPSHMSNATGAGDAFMAAVSWAYLQNHSLKETAIIGQAASSIAVESIETINSTLSIDAIEERLKLVYPEIHLCVS